MDLADESYAGRLRHAAQSRGWTIRDLAKETGFSYEHIRRVISGDPVGSRSFSYAISNVLGLDASEMWRIARLEKARKRFSTSVMDEIEAPSELGDDWALLSTEQKQLVAKLVSELVGRDRPKREHKRYGAPGRIVPS